MVVYWVWLLFVRVRLNRLIDNLFLVLLHYAVRHISYISTLQFIHTAKRGRDYRIQAPILQRPGIPITTILLLNPCQVTTLVPNFRLLWLTSIIFRDDTRRCTAACLLVRVYADPRCIVKMSCIRPICMTTS